jgi:3-oxoacyl-[acyl-carrier-protein] synthase II
VSSPSSAGSPVITGLGALTPLGNSAPDTWRALVEGRSGVRPIAGFDHSELPVHIGAQVQGFDPVAELGPKRARRSARYTQLAIVAAREAIADAGLDVSANPERVGVLIHSAIGGLPETEENVIGMEAHGMHDVSPYWVPSMIPNMGACDVAIDAGAHGPVSASALACASGTAALFDARRLIMSGEADVVLAGGADAGLTATMLAGLSKMGALSMRNDDPAGASRPFDAERDGFVFGEAAVVMVVESAEHAAARGARVYGSILGGALTSDAFHISAPEPSGTYAARAISLALERAGVSASELDYICAHGTATRANDAAETRAIKIALGADAYHVAISSPKSMTGHLIAAAGALSALACLYGMRDNLLPPTTNLHTPDPECDLDYVPLEARSAPLRTAAVNAFGFGGQNCVIVLGAPEG